MVLGIGMGFNEVAAPIYLSEVSPPRIRGTFLMSFQLWKTFGALIGDIVSFSQGSDPFFSWRAWLSGGSLFAVPVLVGLWFFPESPHHWIVHGNYKNAFEALVQLRNVPLQAARDLYMIRANVQREHEMLAQFGFSRNHNMVARFIELFTVPRLRRATQASGIIMFAHQICGCKSNTPDVKTESRG